jgi:hypothetical protein
MCSKEYDDNYEFWYDLVELNNENKVVGSICEHCFDNNTDAEIYDKLHGVPFDSFHSDEVNRIRKQEG